MVRRTRAVARRQELEESDGASNSSEDGPSAQLWKEASQERTPLRNPRPVEVINSVLQPKANARNGAAESSKSAKPLLSREERRLQRDNPQTRSRKPRVDVDEISKEFYTTETDEDPQETENTSAIEVCNKKWQINWSEALCLDHLTSQQRAESHRLLESCRKLASNTSDWDHAKDLVNRCIYFRILAFVYGHGERNSNSIQPLREDIENAAASTWWVDDLPELDESLFEHLHLRKNEYGVLVWRTEKHQKLPSNVRTAKLPRNVRESVIRNFEGLKEGPIRLLFVNENPKRKKATSNDQQAKRPRTEQSAGPPRENPRRIYIISRIEDKTPASSGEDEVSEDERLDKEDQTAPATNTSQVALDDDLLNSSQKRMEDDAQQQQNDQENKENGHEHGRNAEEQLNGQEVGGEGKGSEYEESNDSEEQVNGGPDELELEEDYGRKEHGNRRDGAAEEENAPKDDTSPSSDEESAGDSRGLFGLKGNIEAILARQEGVRRIRKCVKAKSLEVESQTGKALKFRCTGLRKLIKNQYAAISGARTGASQEILSKAEAAKAIREYTSQITNVLDNLDLGHSETYLLQDIYAFIFPALLRCLYDTITILTLFFGRQDGSLPAEHANHIAEFAAAIIKLGDGVRKSNRSPAAHLKIKQPVKNHIVAPLRTWHKQLLGEMQRSAIKEQREADRLKDRRRDELAAQRREEQARRLAKQRERHEDWRRLHLVRMKMEPDPRRMGNLGFVQPPRHWDDDVYKKVDNVDANGEHFDRVDAFEHRRAGASNGGDGASRQQQQHMAQEIVGSDWTDVEGMVLMDALDEYTKRDFENPRYGVYYQIIKKHCAPGGHLRRFNVQEITEKARYFKIWLAGLYDWVDRIPTF